MEAYYIICTYCGAHASSKPGMSSFQAATSCMPHAGHIRVSHRHLDCLDALLQCCTPLWACPPLLHHMPTQACTLSVASHAHEALDSPSAYHTVHYNQKKWGKVSWSLQFPLQREQWWKQQEHGSCNLTPHKLHEAHGPPLGQPCSKASFGHFLRQDT